LSSESKTPDITILTFRDRKVILDGDLALVYGVTTKRLNEQFRRNRKRFPNDFAFHLTAEEFESLRSQAATLNTITSKRSQVVTASADATMWSQIATLKSGRGRHQKYRPWAFTEHGALQVANILRSDRAIAMSIDVIRAFIELRERVAANAVILKRLAEIDKTLLLHDSALRDVYEKLLPLLPPPPPPPRRQIGFSAVS
jgi:hypothetical protein